MKNKSLSVISLVFAFTLALLVCLDGLTAGASGGLWITDGVSDPTDYDYSFAVVGDTTPAKPLLNHATLRCVFVLQLKEFSTRLNSFSVSV